MPSASLFVILWAPCFKKVNCIAIAATHAVLVAPASDVPRNMLFGTRAWSAMGNEPTRSNNAFTNVFRVLLLSQDCVVVFEKYGEIDILDFFDCVLLQALVVVNPVGCHGALRDKRQARSISKIASKNGCASVVMYTPERLSSIILSFRASIAM